MQIYAFVDYDNVRPIRREISDADTESNLLQVCLRATEIAKDRFKGASEVVLRIYDGWLDIRGNPTERAVRLLRVVGKLPRTVHGLRINPELVRGPIFHGAELRGLLKDGGQKMVDSLVVSDITWCALQIECPLILMSDDDDMIPGLICALVCVRSKRRRQPVCLSRQRNEGEGMNDHILSQLGICYEGTA